jgi:hypothetical protein
MGQRTVLAGVKDVVAIKLLTGQHANAQRQRELFLREASISLLLKHQNIVQVHDAGEPEGRAYMVMAWIDGMNLGELLRELRSAGIVLSLRVVAYVLGELLKGLHYAHTIRLGDDRRGVIHRDVSPQNVLLSLSGEVMLADFGVARVVAEETSGELRGKLGYLAPEQLRGGKLDARVDLYAVGVLLHEMADGRAFRDARDYNHMYSLVMSGEVAALQLTTLPTQLERLRLALLQADPAQRVTSAEAALDLLRAWPGYADAGLELAKMVQKLAGVDGLRSGVHAAASASGPMTAAVGHQDETQTARRPRSLDGKDLSAAATTQTQLLSSSAAQRGQGSRSVPPLGVILLSVAGLLLLGLLVWQGRDLPAKVEPPLSGDSATVAGSRGDASPMNPAALPTHATGPRQAKGSVDATPRSAVPAAEGDGDLASVGDKGPGRGPLEAPSARPEGATGASADDTPEGPPGTPAKPTAPKPKPKAIEPATASIFANQYEFAWVKVAGRTHLLEPLKRDLRLKPGTHSLRVALDKAGPYESLGSIKLESGMRYEIRLMKTPPGVSLKRVR